MVILTLLEINREKFIDNLNKGFDVEEENNLSLWLEKCQSLGKGEFQ